MQSLICPACGYDLRDRHGDTCPECGTAWTPEQIDRWRHRNAAPFPVADLTLHIFGIVVLGGFSLLALLRGVGFNQPQFRVLGLVLGAIALIVACSLAALIRRLIRVRQAARLQSDLDTGPGRDTATGSTMDGIDPSGPSEMR